jgi:hypothetical protein
MKNINYTHALSFIVIILSIFYSFYDQVPRDKTDLSTPLTEFSTERAFKYLEVVAAKPHYVGTEEHTKVREYIVQELTKMGLEVSIQEQEAFNEKWKGATYTYNILTRIKGSESGKAVLLLSHYDSTPHSSFGGSDAGSGVVTILESVRAFIASGKKPKNDIIIEISDAEELGLLGAKAFVNYHPWAKEVGLVINLEARGSGGPSYMLLETNGGNHNFIKAFNQANTPFPVANSLLYSIYKKLPNDTDLTVYREDANIDGFNFAFIDDFYDYHSADDTKERLDYSTLAHQGSYVMAMLNYFSDADITNLKSDTDDVFFDFPIFGMVYYPFDAVLPSTIIIALLFLFLFIFGIRKNKLTLKGSAIGFVPFLIALISAVGIGYFGWKLILYIYPQYTDILHKFPYNGHLYIYAFSALILALLFWIYNSFSKKQTITDLMTAPIVFWILINLLIALQLKGGGFFIIPLIGLILSWGILLYTDEKPNKRIFLFTLFVLPTMIIFSPLIKMFPVGLAMPMIGISLVLIVLIFGSSLAVLGHYNNNKHLSKLFLAISIIALIAAHFKSDYTIDRKKPNSVVYIQDVDENKAFFASYDRNTDVYTQQFLGDNPQIGDLSISFGSKYNKKFRQYVKTKSRKVPIPLIQKQVNDTLYKDRNLITYNIKPQRNANVLYITAKEKIDFYSLKINGVSVDKSDKDSDFVFQITKEDNKIISYYLAQGIDSLNIEMEISKNLNPKFELFEISYDLLKNPLFKVTPREKTMMPTPFVFNDAIIVKKDF